MTKLLKPTMTPDAAKKRALDIFRRHLPDAQLIEEAYDPGFNAQVERVWGAGVNVYVRLRKDYDATRAANPEGASLEGERVYMRTLSVEINSSGTGRTLAETLVFVETLRAACAAVAEVEAFLGRERVGGVES